MKKFRKLSLLFLGAAAFSLSACKGNDLPPMQATPALWLVSDDDTKIYVMGSMHALPRHIVWNDGLISQSIAEADKLVLELSPQQSADAGQVFERLSARDKPLPLEERLKGPALAAFEALPAKKKAMLSQHYDDWAIMLLLGQFSAQEAGLDVRYGVETTLSSQFNQESKPIIGLESAESQLMLFETLPAETQRHLLSQSLVKSGTAKAEVDALLASWVKGDMEALENRINADLKASPDAYGALITQRNRRWAAWAVKQMNEAGVVFVAVGAGHLVGPEGLPSLLEQQGFKVERLQ